MSKQLNTTETAPGKPDSAGGAKDTQGLSIYGFRSCPYCQRVLRAAAGLGVEIEFRDTMSDDLRHQELVAATGRTTVPVLRIEGEGDSVRWMPESLDIVAYLEDRFAG